MKKYKCIHGFLIDLVDGDGFTVEEAGYVVEEGTIWEADEEPSRIIGGAVRLIGNKIEWIEICEETLKNCFEEVEEWKIK